MAVIIGKFSTVMLGGQLGESKHRFFKPLSSPTVVRFILAAKLRAFSTDASANVETKPDPISVEEEISTRKKILACPICYQPFMWNNDLGLSVESMAGSSFRCNSCKKPYLSNETHIDLTVTSGAKEYHESMPSATEFFRAPLISFLYERGWRQNFIWAGFPGLEKEFELAKGYLKPVLGGTIIDASCGSGLFSRLFAKSGLFSLVVALDFSENMLQQCYEFVKQEEDFPKENLLLVRADISRLPFASSSVDAVHAAAAVHCWPSPSSAVAEVSRVLRPGGVFVATTHIHDGPFPLFPFIRPLRQNVAHITGSRAFLSEHELEDLCKICGLEGFTCMRNGGFAMISAAKPG